MSIKFYIRLTLLILLLLGLTLPLKRAYAYKDWCSYSNTSITHQTNLVFCSYNPGTTWGISGVYSDKYTDQIAINDLWEDQGPLAIDQPCGTSYYGVWSYPGDYTPSVNDFATWHSACVDPTEQINISGTAYRCGNGAYNLYDTFIPTTCQYDPGTTTIKGNPASCDQPNGWGYVDSSSWCPSGPYCMYGGNTDDNLCRGAFNQPQLVNTAPSSCGYGGTCNYSYCSIANNGQFNYGQCNNTTDTTGARCGSTCIAPTKYDCVNNACAIVSGGPFTEATCGGTCATPAPTFGCSTAPTYAPPPPNPGPNGPNKFPQTVAPTTGSCVNGTTCSVTCSWTCTDNQNRTCAANPCSTVWACQGGGTQWYNDGTYYATCPNQCRFCNPGDKIINCSIANACPLP